MTLDEINEAISQGKTVCWINENHEVVKPNKIKNIKNGASSPLTWGDGYLLKGNENDYFIK